MARTHAPLAPAQDAIAVDTTSLSIDVVFNQLLHLAVNRGLCSGGK
jgi:cytidylate kinase